MRVISGTAKSRKLKSPPAATRPITDRAKESLFNILGARVLDARVLDLFAGAGSVGIEALSRGARHATFVEMDDGALRVLRANLRLAQVAARATVAPENVFKFVKRAPSAPYDIIYIAPPQYQELWSRTLRALDQREFITLDGVIVAQIHPKEYRELELASYHLADQRKYGSVMLCFYRRKETHD